MTPPIHPDFDIVDFGQIRLRTVKSFSVFEQLTEGKRRCAFHPQFSENATEGKHIHCFGDLVGGLASLERLVPLEGIRVG